MAVRRSVLVKSTGTAGSAYALEVLQPHLTAGDHPVVGVGDGDQPQLLAPTAVNRFGGAVHHAGADGAQEVGVVVDSHDIPAAAGGEPGVGGHAGHALDHRAVDTAVHEAHRLQQFGRDLELGPRAVGAEFGELQPHLAVERRGEIRRDGRFRRQWHVLCLHHRSRPKALAAGRLPEKRASPVPLGHGARRSSRPGVTAALRTLPRSLFARLG